MNNTSGFDVRVLDQDEHPVSLAEVHRGFDVMIIHVDIPKPPAALQPEDAMTVLAAALLGLNLQRDVRAIAVDVRNELTRMGYEVRSTRDE